MGGGRSSSSSGEEDGDADWKAAIDSVATTNAVLSTSTTLKPRTLKLYHVKAQKLLGDILDKRIEIVRAPIHLLDKDSVTNDGGVRLFKGAPLGILFDQDELQGPRKRPRIVPGEEIDEKSKKFKHQLLSVAVDGTDIIAAARDACQKSLAHLQAKEAAAKATAKTEEERVAELKRIRGERWLPSIARNMQANSRGC